MNVCATGGAFITGLLLAQFTAAVLFPGGLVVMAVRATVGTFKKAWRALFEAVFSRPDKRLEVAGHNGLRPG